MANAKLEVVGVSVYYGAVPAIRDVHLSIAANRVTALIGPSGCGKSTLLRSLNRMHETTRAARVEGAVLVDGIDIYDRRVDVNHVRRAIGMVFQQPNPFPTMSVHDNVVAGLLLHDRRTARQVLDETCERALRRVNLWDEVKDRLHEPGTSLSGGQQQRLCIARAIAVRPSVLLMDEPASALDPHSTAAVEDLVRTLAEEVTVVIVTHNMEQARRVSHTTAFLTLDAAGEPGRLVEVGATDELFADPRDPRTAAYVAGRFG